jgi:hypothetical protein
MRWRLSLLASIVGLGVLTACSDNATAPESSLDEVNASADALALAERLALPGTNADRETGSAPTGMQHHPCRYDEIAGRWGCAPVTREGLTIHRSFAYFDADGKPMRRFDPQLTAAANTRNAVHGTMQRENATVKIRSTGDMTVSGLLGEETTRTLDGREVGVREVERATDQGPAKSRLEFANRTVAVVVPVPRRGDNVADRRLWPLSGQAIRGHALSVSRNGETHVERWRETVTFNGTALVPVEIVNARGTRHCVRNLETGTTRCE